MVPPKGARRMIVRRNVDEPESCSNCGEKIGRLETPHIWNQFVVCARCRQKLEADSMLAGQSRASGPTPKEFKEGDTMDYASLSSQQSSPPVVSGSVRGPQIICPNPRCGYVGPGKKIAKGSMVAGCLLMLFFLLPGILYLMFTSGYHIVCPRCGMQIRDE